MKNLVFVFVLAPFSAFAQDGTSTTSLPNMVVTGSAVEQEVRQAPASLSVVTREDLERENFRDVGDALKYAEGVMITGGAQDRGVSLRGFGAGYTLILVDGQRLDSRSLTIRHNADGDLGWVPLSSVERIEVVRGPMSSLYGAEALGGVINIITKKGGDRWRASLEARQTESEDARAARETKYGVYTSGPLWAEKLTLKVTGHFGDRSTTDYAADDVRQVGGQREAGASAELGWKITPTQELAFQAGQDDDRREPGEAAASETRMRKASFGARHFWRAETTGMETLVRRDDYDYENGQGPARLVRDTGSAKLTFAAGANHVLVTGLDSETNVLENRRNILSGQTSAWQHAAFAEDSWTLAPGHTLTFGGRYTRHQRFGGQASPRAYYVAQLHPEWTLKTGAGTGFKSPTLFQLEEGFRLPSCRGRCQMIGNPNLRPENSVSGEVGLSFERGGWSAGATYYQAELRDMVTTSFATIDGARYRLLGNVALARTRGIESSLKRRFGRTEARLSYTRSHGENVTDGTPLTAVPRDVANAGLDYRLTDRLSSYVSALHTGVQVVDDGGTKLDLDPYTVVNAGGNYVLPRAWMENSKVGFGVQNLANLGLDNRYGYGELGRRYYLRLQVETR